MEFEIKKKGLVNAGQYNKENIDLAYKFASEAYKEFKGLVKSIVLFGSTARGKESNDIDVLIIVDDVSVNLTREMVETYRIINQKIVSKVSDKLHITTLKLTTFWEYVRAGDPVAINILRDGVAVVKTFVNITRCDGLVGRGYGTFNRQCMASIRWRNCKPNAEQRKQDPKGAD